MRYSLLLLLGIFALATAAVAEPISDRITVTVRGQGPDVILIPGLGCSSAVWNDTAAHLESQYCVHLVQVAGFAGAPAEANAHGAIIVPTEEAIDAYIKTNQLKAPKIIGHSLGGLMGLILAMRHPEDVDKLMIVDSLPFYGILTGATNSASAAPQAAMMRDSILAESQDYFAKIQTQFMRSLVKSPAGRQEVIGWAVISDKSVVARAFYEDAIADLRPKLPVIKTPITLLYPWDPLSGFPQDATDKLYQDNFAPLPNKTLIRIDGSFHFIMLDQPGAFEAQVDKFLK